MKFLNFLKNLIFIIFVALVTGFLLANIGEPARIRFPWPYSGISIHLNVSVLILIAFSGGLATGLLYLVPKLLFKSFETKKLKKKLSHHVAPATIESSH